MTLHVDSEVGRLRQAILHRPDLELKRLTPTNHDEYLFDDVLWVKHAKQEHDAFAETLRDQGVQVHLLHELLTETRRDPRGTPLHPRADLRRAGVRADGARRAARGLQPARRRRARHLPHRRHDQARAAGAGAGARLGGGPGAGARRPAAAPAPQPPVHPGHLGLGLRRRVDQLDAQARPDARDHPLRGHLPLAPRVRRRELPHLGRGLGERDGDDRGRRHPRPRPRRGARRHERADHPPGRRAARHATLRGRQREQDRGAVDAAEAGVHAPRHRDDDGRRGDVHQVRRPRRCCRRTRSSRATPRRS